PGDRGRSAPTLLPNPLAGPGVLGGTSGASLTVVIATLLGGGLAAASSLGGALPWQAGPALARALRTLRLVRLPSRARGLVNPLALVLTGVVVSVLCGAGVMFIQHVSGALSLGSARVLIGELSDDWEWPHLAAMGAVAALAFALSVAAGPAIDAASL